MLVLPSPLEHVDVEERLEFCGDVLEKRENAFLWMLVPEGVEDETFLRDESVTISGKPFSG